MKTNRIDHIGINVLDINAAKEFFLAMGFTVAVEADMEGEWIGRIIDLPHVKDRMVMMRAPGEALIELVQFHSPLDLKGLQHTESNTLGIRHICFAVDDVEGMVKKLEQHGGKLMGEIYNYKDIYKLCYIRGPEGIILELAEELKK